jgi:hypothetical protein
MKTKRGPNVWVIHYGKKFSVKEEGSRSAIVPSISQRNAVRIGRLIAQANGSELVVQAKNGRIRVKDSHGSDPFPPRG